MVADWASDEEFPTFPVGSQPKELLICPEDLVQPPLIPGHKYLFKTPRGWQSYQIWSEILASELGRLCGVPVPPCYLGIGEHGRPGALVEFFYGFPGAHSEDRFVHGSDVLQRSISDKKVGRPHGIRTNVMLTRRYGVADAAVHWGKILMFDALIGNRDRHPDNWGLVWHYRQGQLPAVELSPAFDNATSLGYEQTERRLTADWTSEWLDKYLSRGVHHCGWSPADDVQGKHVDLCVRFGQTFPEAGEAMKSVIEFDVRELRRVVEGLTDIHASLPLTDARSRFMIDLILGRRDRLRTAWGG